MNLGRLGQRADASLAVLLALGAPAPAHAADGADAPDNLDTADGKDAVGAADGPGEVDGDAPATQLAAPELPPVQRDELLAHAPSPQLDVGWFLGACGTGDDALWQGTDFGAGAIVDALWLRRRYADLGLGGYAQVATSGFFDFRGSLGVSGHLPLGGLALGLRTGGYVHTDGSAARPGVEGFVEFGLRSLNFSGRYSLTNTLLAGLQYTPDGGSRTTTLWLAIRLDGFWLAAPFGLL